MKAYLLKKIKGARWKEGNRIPNCLPKNNYTTEKLFNKTHKSSTIQQSTIPTNNYPTIINSNYYSHIISLHKISTKWDENNSTVIISLLMSCDFPQQHAG